MRNARIGIVMAILALPAFAPGDGAPAPPAPVEWYVPGWAAAAPYNKPIRVLDTESALGRYALQTKDVGLADIVRFHGHLCDGMVIAYVELREALVRLFPNGVVDRTDLRG